MTMKINQIKSERIGDTYYQMEHPTGLKIFVYPKENSHFYLCGISGRQIRFDR